MTDSPERRLLAEAARELRQIGHQFGWLSEELLRDIDALLAQPEAAQAAPAPEASGKVPEGWKLVPVEPTRAMLHGMAVATFLRDGSDAEMVRRWNGALAAAPSAEKT